MGLFDFFKRRSPIRDGAALGDFIDRNAAFVVQKGLYEYSRARAGHYAKVLFADPGFHAAVENSRWRAYPLGLAMVAEVADNVLHSDAREGRAEGLEQLNALVLSVFDRYPVPASLGEQVWRDERAELDRRLRLIGMHAPKRAFDICEPWVDTYFNLMPIHEKLRGRDYPAIRNYLRVTMTNVHDQLTNRLDPPAAAKSLLAGPVAAN